MLELKSIDKSKQNKLVSFRIGKNKTANQTEVHFAYALYIDFEYMGIQVLLVFTQHLFIQSQECNHTILTNQ